MSKISFATHPFLLGFDELERMMERSSKNGSDGYPPFNIEQFEEGKFRITLAVAGFAESELSITLEDRQLTIGGKQANMDEERMFLHRGIASRQFSRTFLLAEGVEVSGANLENGLLHVDMQRKVPESVVQNIPISPFGQEAKP